MSSASRPRRSRRVGEPGVGGRRRLAARERQRLLVGDVQAAQRVGRVRVARRRRLDRRAHARVEEAKATAAATQTGASRATRVGVALDRVARAARPSAGRAAGAPRCWTTWASSWASSSSPSRVPGRYSPWPKKMSPPTVNARASPRGPARRRRRRCARGRRRASRRARGARAPRAAVERLGRRRAMAAIAAWTSGCTRPPARIPPPSPCGRQRLAERAVAHVAGEPLERGPQGRGCARAAPARARRRARGVGARRGRPSLAASTGQAYGRSRRAAQALPGCRAGSPVSRRPAQDGVQREPDQQAVRSAHAQPAPGRAAPGR